MKFFNTPLDIEGSQMFRYLAGCRLKRFLKEEWSFMSKDVGAAWEFDRATEAIRE